jgi:hypothetical protein
MSKTLGLYSQASNTLATAFHNLQLTSGGGGGSQSLQQVLVVGNTTGGNDIVQSSGDAFRSSTNADLRLELDGSGTVLVEQNNFAGQAQPIMSLRTNDNGSGGSTLEFFTNSATPVSGDLIGNIEFNANTSPVFNKTQYGIIECQIDDATFGNHGATFNFALFGGGALSVPLQITSSNIIPSAISDSLNSIGTVGQVLSCSNSLTGALQWITLPLTTGMTATGGTITTYYEGSTRYTAHTFLTTGSFTITSFGTNVVPEIEILVVGGGGGGGSTNGAANFAGGGGAGCVIQITGFPLNLTATLPDTITCSVGGGGAGGTPGNTGTSGATSTLSIPANLMVNNVALGIDARGGGGGAGGINAPVNGIASTYGWTTMAGSTITTVSPTSSSGGGAQGSGSSTTTPTAVFNSSVGELYSAEYVRGGGYRGGIGTTGSNRAGCGGGGASAAGGQPTTVAQYVAGTGTGMATYWGGSKRLFGGGGLGATSGTVVVNPTSALYGGGIGEAIGSVFSATAGSANTGSGGGGSSSLGIAGASGGSGIIIVRYRS